MQKLTRTNSVLDVLPFVNALVAFVTFKSRLTPTYSSFVAGSHVLIGYPRRIASARFAHYEFVTRSLVEVAVVAFVTKLSLVTLKTNYLELLSPPLILNYLPCSYI